MISGVQRSAKISAPRAWGQYWPYVTVPLSRPLPGLGSQTLTPQPRSARWCADAVEHADDRPASTPGRPVGEEAATMGDNGFRGELIAADDTAYDTARAVWNGTIDRRPRVIAQCGGTA